MFPIHAEAIARTFAARISRRAALRGIGGSGLAVAALGGAGLGAGRAVRAVSTAETDASSAFAYRLETSQPVQYDGGLARVATQREFPMLAGMAIRSEEFAPGALQAPHWHPNAGEVHYVMAGTGSAGVVSPGGDHAIFDLRPGSVSFFPKGHYHYVHNSGSEPMRVLAVLTHEAPARFGAGDVFGLVPKPILAEVLGVAMADLPDLPAPADRSVVSLTGTVTAPAADPAAKAPDPYTLNLDQLEPVVYEGGTVTNVRGKEFARLDGMSFLPLYVNAGGVREPHWHPNAAELIYVRGGQAEIGLVTADGELEQFTIGAGDVAFFPLSWFHYVASVGEEPLDSIVYLNHAAPARIDLSDAVGYVPLAVTATGVGLDAGALDGLPRRTGVVVAAASGS
jgi:oxalate decarboxylase